MRSCLFFRKVMAKVRNMFHNPKLFFKKNSSTILTCIGAVGVIATTTMAVKETPKALRMIEEIQREQDEPLTTIEKVKISAPVYIPSFIVGAATITCIFGANMLNRRQQAALTSAYAFIDSSYREYKNKLKELYGEETHEEIVNAIAVEKANDVYIHSNFVCDTCNLAAEEHSGGIKTFYDEYSQRYFESTIEQVITAEYHLNRNFVLRGYACLNELYSFLGIEPTQYGSEVGWSICDDEIYWIDFNHRKVVMDDGLEIYIIEIPYTPSVEYQE